MNTTLNDFYISSLHAEGVRLFETLDIKFNSKFNFIIGSNGTGKTSILRCLALCLSTNQIHDSRYSENTCVWFDFVQENEKYRVGQGKPLANNPSWVVTKGYMQALHSANYVPPNEGVKQAYNTNEIENKISHLSPLFIGAYRKIDYKRIDGMKRENQLEESRNTYRRNAALNLNGSYLPDVKQWLINRYFIIDKDWAETEKANWHWLMNNLKYLSPSNADFKFNEIRQDLEPKFILNGNECHLEELSAGFQSVLAIVLAIFEWIEAVNEGNSRLVQNAYGTIIIDELDAHLHPEWQLTIRDSLERLFPNLQFIITTHSPHLIATAKPGEVLRLPKHDGILNVEPSTIYYAGWNTDQILEEVMDVQSIKSKIYEQLVAKALRFSDQHKPEEMKSTIDELKTIAHPSDTIVAVLSMKLASILMEETND